MIIQIFSAILFEKTTQIFTDTVLELGVLR